jgi:hypothetical protein
VLSEAAGWEADAALIRVAVALFEERDEFARQGLEAVAAGLARLYPAEGAARVTRYPGPAQVVPGSVSDLVKNLAAVSGTEADPGPEGAISIQRITAPGGRPHWVVYAPGTDDLVPWHHDDTARDLAADFRLVAGADTTYGDGIRQAMRSAGVGPRDPVMIVGHSQGGMQAVSLLAGHTGFTITNVVALGAPAVRAEFAPGDGVHVLSLENSGDLVPFLAGKPGAVTAGQVTVRFEDSRGPDSAHDLKHYARGARAADLSGEPGIAEQIASMSGFLNGVSGSVSGYLITR